MKWACLSPVFFTIMTAKIIAAAAEEELNNIFILRFQCFN